MLLLVVVAVAVAVAVAVDDSLSPEHLGYVQWLLHLSLLLLFHLVSFQWW